MNYIEMLKNAKISNPENLQATREYLEKEENEKIFYVSQKKNGSIRVSWNTLPSTGKLFYADGSVVRLRPCHFKDFPV